MIKFIFEIVSGLLIGIIDKFIFYIDDDKKYTLKELGLEMEE